MTNPRIQNANTEVKTFNFNSILKSSDFNLLTNRDLEGSFVSLLMRPIDARTAINRGLAIEFSSTVSINTVCLTLYANRCMLLYLRAGSIN